MCIKPGIVLSAPCTALVNMHNESFQYFTHITEEETQAFYKRGHRVNKL